MDATALVTAFNTLPRPRLSPSTSVPNHWHISLRHVPLQPPSSVLFIIQPHSRYVHVEGPLPPSVEDASTEVKATVWAMLLLKAFNGGLGAGAANESAGGAVTIGRPWSWVCNDAEMAGALGETLRGMGVTAPEGVGLAGEEENEIGDEEWGSVFGKLNTLGEDVGKA